MTERYLIFADNTVCVNFAYMGLMPVLEILCAGHGRWCRVVSQEAARSKQFAPNIEQAFSIFGDPIDPDPVERQETSKIQEDMLESGDPRTKNLGEAETIAVVERRYLGRAFIITDDGGARRQAAARGIPIVDTYTLLARGVRHGHVEREALDALIDTLIASGQRVPWKYKDPKQRAAWIASIEVKV